MQKEILHSFQEACKRTRNPSLSHEEYLLNGSMGLAGEATETLEVVFRHKYNLSDGVTRDLLVKELGDIAWYCADFSTTIGVPLEDTITFDLQHVSEPWKGREHDAEGFAIHLAVVGGKILERVKKEVFHRKLQPSSVQLVGQMLFYIALLGSTIDASLEYILQTNVDKLKNRYPDGFKAQSHG